MQRFARKYLDAITTRVDNDSGMPDDHAVSVTPKYLIGVVTKLTGLSIDVVRVWERRYGAVRPARSGGGTRLYSDADVLRLRRLHRAVENGYGIGQAARLSESELDELIADAQSSLDRADPYRSVRDRFIAAVQTMDVVAADQELARAATLFPARELVMRIVSPIFDEVSERRARKEFGVAHERVASVLLRRMLGSLLRFHPPSGNLDTLVLATPAGERHEIDLLPAALLAAAHGWRVVYLGADLPAAEIALAVRLTNARVLALSLATGQAGIGEELDSISRLVSGSTRVWLSGAGASGHREHIDRANWILVRDLEELDDRLRR
ncbi:MAG: MerR family transcriptional regulator [Acidobacteriota bacterium]